jgi:prophage regulatory protein
MNSSPSSSSASGPMVRLLRIDQVRQRTGLGRTATYELIARGQHPAPVKLGRSSRWVDREVDAWVEQVVRQRSL